MRNGKHLAKYKQNEKVPKSPKEDWIEIFRIQAVVLTFMGVTYFDIMKETRKREIVDVRNLLIWFLWKRSGMNKADLAGYFCKDHTTIIHAINSVQDQIETDDIISQRVRKINKILI